MMRPPLGVSPSVRLATESFTATGSSPSMSTESDTVPRVPWALGGEVAICVIRTARLSWSPVPKIT